MSERQERWLTVDNRGRGVVACRYRETAEGTAGEEDRLAPEFGPHCVAHLVELRDGERVVAVGEEAVERVAAAMCPGGPRFWPHYTDQTHDGYRKQARAAFTALLTPPHGSDT